MARLSVYLLGSFQAMLDADLVADFGYNKVRALLAYLAVEVDRPHTRRSLAALLYPENADRVAGSNLRRALFTLRGAIGNDDATPPYLRIANETVQFDRQSSYWLDVEAFAAAIQSTRAHKHRSLKTCAPCMQQLAEAVAL